MSTLHQSRRQFYQTAFGTLAASGAISSAELSAEAPSVTKPLQPLRPTTARAALDRLIAGNRRFVEGRPIRPDADTEWRQRLLEGQHPFATIVCCSDSRVPPELLFDEGFGDLFVVRVAGNVVGPDVIGSIEYGVDHTSTPLVLVMGHEGCGAVCAALESIKDEPDEIKTLVRKIQRGIADVPSDLPPKERIHQAVITNVQNSVSQLKQVPDLQQAIASGKTQIIGGVYEMHTGAFRLLDDSPIKIAHRTNDDSARTDPTCDCEKPE